MGWRKWCMWRLPNIVHGKLTHTTLLGTDNNPCPAGRSGRFWRVILAKPRSMGLFYDDLPTAVGRGLNVKKPYPAYIESISKKIVWDVRKMMILLTKCISWGPGINKFNAAFHLSVFWYGGRWHIFNSTKSLLLIYFAHIRCIIHYMYIV